MGHRAMWVPAGQVAWEPEEAGVGDRSESCVSVCVYLFVLGGSVPASSMGP